MRKIIVYAAFGALMAPSAAVSDRLTQSCNTFSHGVVLVVASATGGQLAAVVSNPEINPGLFERLWKPSSATWYSLFDLMFMDYEDSLQDTVEIAAAIGADPLLAALGVESAGSSVGACFSPGPPPVAVQVTEYHNAHLDHYFLSSSDTESAIIDAGGAGPGWSRTGESWRTFASDVCYDIRPVRRFYHHGANTHFFTVDPSECGQVRRSDPGWTYEGDAFGASMPEGGTCPPGMTSIHRLYRNRWTALGGPNHRYVARARLRDEMISQGWVYEGVAMCL